MLAVVSDSSPLIYLTRLGQFHLLRCLHDAVIVPQAVWQEVAVGGQGLTESGALRTGVAEGWIQVKTPHALPATLGAAGAHLGRGDVEAILLAQEWNAILLTDDAEARDLAESVAIKVTGTVGLLIRAKSEGHVTSLKMLLDRLRTNTNFRISDSLCQHALGAGGEL